MTLVFHVYIDINIPFNQDTKYVFQKIAQDIICWNFPFISSNSVPSVKQCETLYRHFYVILQTSINELMH